MGLRTFSNGRDVGAALPSGTDQLYGVRLASSVAAWLFAPTARAEAAFGIWYNTYNVRDFRGCEQLGVAAITPGEFLKLIGKNA